MSTTTYVTSIERWQPYGNQWAKTYWRHNGTLLEWHTQGSKWRTQDANVDAESVLTHIRLCEYDITNVRTVNHRNTG